MSTTKFYCVEVVHHGNPRPPVIVKVEHDGPGRPYVARFAGRDTILSSTSDDLGNAIMRLVGNCGYLVRRFVETEPVVKAA